MSTQINKELLEVLNAREQRWQMRLKLSQQHSQAIVTITMCLPLKYRTEDKYKGILAKLYSDFLVFLANQGYGFTPLSSCDGADGTAYFVAVNGDTEKIKRLCVAAEDTFLLGRILDIDLMRADGTAISRGDYNLLPRKCFVCDKPASICVSRKLHTNAEVEKAIEDMLSKTTI